MYTEYQPLRKDDGLNMTKQHEYEYETWLINHGLRISFCGLT